MRCSNCGSELDQGAKFCAVCGNPVKIRTSESGHSYIQEIHFERPWRNAVKYMAPVWVVVFIVSVFLGYNIYLHHVNAKWSGQETETESGKSEIESAGIQKEEEADETEKLDYSYLALVRNHEGKFGFINEKGEEIIACKYDLAREFGTNGLAAVAAVEENGEEETGGWGFINAGGEVVIPFEYSGVGGSQKSFRDNYMGFIKTDQGEYVCVVAKAEEKDENGGWIWKWGLINDRGEEIIECKYEEANGGYAWLEGNRYLLAKDKNEEGISYAVLVDINGKEIVSAADQYEQIRVERGELIAVSKMENGEEIWGYINQDGEVVIPFQYQRAFGFSENGLAAVAKEEEPVVAGQKTTWWGYIDETGKEMITYQYLDADTYFDEWVCVENADFKYGCIDEKGDEVLPFIYDNPIAILDKQSGLLKISRDGKQGVITLRGEEVVPCIYDRVELCENSGYILTTNYVDSDNHLYQFNFIDKNGEFLTPVVYNAVTQFGDNGWAATGIYKEHFDEFSDRYSCQYIDQSGNVVLELPEEYICAGKFIKIQ